MWISVCYWTSVFELCFFDGKKPSGYVGSLIAVMSSNGVPYTVIVLSTTTYIGTSPPFLKEFIYKGVNFIMLVICHIHLFYCLNYFI